MEEKIDVVDKVVKKCRECGEIKEVEKYFTKSKNVKDGYENKCKRCRLEAKKKYKCKCEICSNIFITTKFDTKYCSNQCIAESKKKRTTVKCSYCNENVEILECLLKTYKNHYCNSKCKSEHQKTTQLGKDNFNYTKIKYKCDGCLTEIFVEPYKLKHLKHNFCSKECYKKNIGKFYTKNLEYDGQKKCNKCGVTKLSEKFCKDKSSKDGLTGVCKECTRKRHKHICKICNEIFYTDKKNSVCCSVKCRSIERVKERKELSCDSCGKVFYRLKSQLNGKHHKFCSYKCANAGFSKFFSGENAPNYNPNLTNEERIENRRIEGYNKWLNDVYRRDGYMCQACGDNKGGNLNAHHIYNYSEHKDKRLEISNGITFCNECHKLFHKKYKYKNNNKEQVKEFLIAFNKILIL